MQGIWVDYKSFHGELRGFRSSCRRNEAAFGGEAVAKSDNGVRQLKPVLRIYDDYDPNAASFLRQLLQVDRHFLPPKNN